MNAVALSVGVVVTLAVVAQWLYVGSELSHETDAELQAWARELAAQLVTGDRLDAVAARRIEINAQHWMIQAASGVVVDIDGPVPDNLVPDNLAPVTLAEASSEATPTWIVSEFGERWRILRKQLADGWVAVGILAPDCVEPADAKLAEAAWRCGSTLAEALALDFKKVAPEIEVAVVDGSGRLKSASGGVPVRSRTLAERDARIAPWSEKLGPHAYRFAVWPLRSTTRRLLGRLIVDKETTEQKAVMRELTYSGGALALVGWLPLLVMALSQAHDRHRFLTPAEAIRSGEGERVEFKTLFQWDSKRNEPSPFLRREVVKSVAAFVNSQGGQLFIGVDDNGNLHGLDHDLSPVGGSVDKLLQTLSNVLCDQLGPPVSSLCQIQVNQVEGKALCVVNCHASPEPVFAKGERGHEFFVRTGSRTTSLDAKDAHTYIRRHWG